MPGKGEDIINNLYEFLISSFLVSDILIHCYSKESVAQPFTVPRIREIGHFMLLRTTKKCTEKHDTLAKLLFCIVNILLLLCLFVCFCCCRFFIFQFLDMPLLSRW